MDFCCHFEKNICYIKCHNADSYATWCKTLQKESFSGFVIKLWVVNNKNIFPSNFRSVVVATVISNSFFTSYLFCRYSMHLNISQFPDLTASNNIDVPKISDTMFGDVCATVLNTFCIMFGVLAPSLSFAYLLVP